MAVVDEIEWRIEASEPHLGPSAPWWHWHYDDAYYSTQQRAEEDAANLRLQYPHGSFAFRVTWSPKPSQRIWTPTTDGDPT